MNVFRRVCPLHPAPKCGSNEIYIEIVSTINWYLHYFLPRSLSLYRSSSRTTITFLLYINQSITTTKTTNKYQPSPSNNTPTNTRNNASQSIDNCTTYRPYGPRSKDANTTLSIWSCGYASSIPTKLIRRHWCNSSRSARPLPPTATGPHTPTWPSAVCGWQSPHPPQTPPRTTTVPSQRPSLRLSQSLPLPQPPSHHYHHH